MYQTHHFKDKFILFLKIFFPILIYQFANYSASFVDTTMTGQYNTMDLAGVSMATSISVSYTHLDVYKRQVQNCQLFKHSCRSLKSINKEFYYNSFYRWAIDYLNYQILSK